MSRQQISLEARQMVMRAEAAIIKARRMAMLSLETVEGRSMGYFVPEIPRELLMEKHDKPANDN